MTECIMRLMNVRASGQYPGTGTSAVGVLKVSGWSG
jgi:hypothetical protein